jgi:hypothetical protein
MSTCVFVIRSENKIRGNNNNYEIVVPFTRRLPHGFNKFQLRSSFYLYAGDYIDFSIAGVNYFKAGCEVRINFANGRNYDTDAPFKSQLTLGFANREVLPNFLGNNNNIDSKGVMEYKLIDSITHIVDYPTSELLNVQIWNINVQFGASDLLTTAVDNGTGDLVDGQDCTDSIIVLEFTGVE